MIRLHHWRVYLAGRRVHHGLVGMLLTLVGVALMVDDKQDWPWPLADP